MIGNGDIGDGHVVLALLINDPILIKYTHRVVVWMNDDEMVKVMEKPMRNELE